jgi:hypothetical protein
MKHNDDIEKKLSGIQVPGITESEHRDRLKRELQNKFTSPGGREVRMRMNSRKILLLALIVILLTATAAWAYNRYRQIEVEVNCANGEMKMVVTDENGTREYTEPIDPSKPCSGKFVTIGEDGKPVVSDELPQEIKDALIRNDYTVEEVQETVDGVPMTLYHYKINVGEGKEIDLKVNFKLEDLIKDEENEEEK